MVAAHLPLTWVAKGRGIRHSHADRQAWTAVRREACANDQGQLVSPVAVTARSNRSKADQDPAEWLPPSPDALCR